MPSSMAISVAANGPIDLSLLAGVESIDIYISRVALAETFPQYRFVGECSLEDGDVAKCEESVCPSRGGIAAKGSDRIFLVSDQAADDGQALSARPADDEDLRNGLGGHRCLHWFGTRLISRLVRPPRHGAISCTKSRKALTFAGGRCRDGWYVDRIALTRPVGQDVSEFAAREPSVKADFKALKHALSGNASGDRRSPQL